MKVNGITIHSNYSPKKEAFNFLAKQNIPEGFHIFIIVGGGKGYLEEAVKARYPGSKTLVFYLDDLFSSHIPAKRKNYWFPGDPILPFLEREIHDYLLNKIILLSWYPCSKAFPSVFKKVTISIKNFLDRRNASIVTTANFGKRWIRNCILNFRNTTEYLSSNSINSPIIITASGPSLELSLDFLKKYRSKYILFSLPSSLSALKTAGIKPDLIVSTDAGFWNTFHFSCLEFNDTPIASPLTASYNKLSNPLFLLSQNSFIEQFFIRAAGLSALQIPSNGTVSGTALMLALNLSKKSIIFAGLDFSYYDIHEHVRPHTFDILFELSQTRFRPILSILFLRKYGKIIPGKNNTRAFDTYALWFNNIGKFNNLYHLNPMDVELDTFKSINNTELEKMFLSCENYKNPSFYKDPVTSQAQDKDILINSILEHLIFLLKSSRQELSKDFKLHELNLLFKKNPLLLELIEFTEFSSLINLINNSSISNLVSAKEFTKMSISTENFLKGFMV